MPRLCAVPFCKKIRGSPKYRHVNFHKFPKDPLRRKEWFIKCQIVDLPNYDLYNVCSDHFTESDYVSIATGAKKLRPNAVPSRRLPPDGFCLQKLEPEMVVVDADPLPLVSSFGDGASALSDPKVYQHMMLVDDIQSRSKPKNHLVQPPPANSVPKLSQNFVVKNHSTQPTPVNFFPQPSQNFVIKVLKFLSPPPVQKVSPDEESLLCDLKSKLEKQINSPKAKEEIVLSDLKSELLVPPPIRSPLTTMNDLVSVIQYDHSYAMPYSNDLVHRTPSGSNYPVNENGQFDQSLYNNDVGTMTELSGEEWDKFFEIEREIKWLWQRNQKMHEGMTSLVARNRELVHDNLRTRKELLVKTEMLSKVKKQIGKLKLKHPEIDFDVE